MLNSDKSRFKTNKKLLFILFVSLLFIFTSGCAEKKLVNDPLTGEILPPENLPTLVDGHYKASTYFYDPRGYIQELDLSIKNGIITQVNYKETSKTGIDRIVQEGEETTWDDMEPLTLSSIHFRLYNGLLLTQSPEKIQAITGGTQTTDRFISLATAAIEQASKGNPDPVKIETEDTYTIRSQIDPGGYQGVLVATFRGAVLTSLSYDEIRVDDGKSKSKLIDNNNPIDYKERFESLTRETMKNQDLSPVFSDIEPTAEVFKYAETLKILKDYRTSP